MRIADDYPTEFSAGVAQCVGAEGQFGPFFQHRSEDDLVVGEIGGAFIDDEGTIEIGYAVVESQWNRGFASAAVDALVTRKRRARQGVGAGGLVAVLPDHAGAGLSAKRTTGVEPATFGLGSRRSAN